MLTYIGNGASLPHIPARDLRDDEIEALGGVTYLVTTGLYEAPVHEESKPVRKAKPATEPSEDEAEHAND